MKAQIGIKDKTRIHENRFKNGLRFVLPLPAIAIARPAVMAQLMMLTTNEPTQIFSSRFIGFIFGGSGSGSGSSIIVQHNPTIFYTLISDETLK
jgi:hypothetical protein